MYLSFTSLKYRQHNLFFSTKIANTLLIDMEHEHHTSGLNLVFTKYKELLLNSSIFITCDISLVKDINEIFFLGGAFKDAKLSMFSCTQLHVTHTFTDKLMTMGKLA